MRKSAAYIFLVSVIFTFVQSLKIEIKLELEPEHREAQLLKLIKVKAYRGGNHSKMSDFRSKAEIPHVWVDKDSVPHYDGHISYADEWEERALLGFGSVSTDENRAGAFVFKLKNALTGRAWTLIHRKDEVSLPTINRIAYESGEGNNGPLLAVHP